MALKGESCNPGLECPLYPNCYEDLHHLVPRWLGKLAARSAMPEEYKKLVRDYIAHPMNHIVGCRWVHATELDKQTPNELPPQEEMRSWLDAQKAKEDRNPSQSP